MGAVQFVHSLRRIARNPNIGTLRGIRRHLDWQLRRARNAFPCELPLSGSVLVAPNGACGVSALVNAHGLYDYNNMQLMRLLLEPGGCFVDVGANIGAYSLVASEASRGRVIAFEPHPDTCATLRRNVARNARRNVEVVCAAVGRINGQVAITDTPGSSITHIVSRAGTAGPDTICVPMLRLDTLLGERQLHPTAIKIDVEGFEADVIRGLGTRIHDAAVIQVEINEFGARRADGAATVRQLLSRAGFIGPVYYDADRRRFSSALVHHGEDPLFVNCTRVAGLASTHGIRMPDRA